MQANLQKVPFLRLLIPFAGGIIWHEQLVLQPDEAFIWIALFVMLGLQMLRFFLRMPYSFRWVDGVLVTLFAFATGWLSTHLSNPAADKYHLLHYQSDILMARISDAPEKRELTTRFTLKVIAVKDSLGSVHKASGSIITFASNNEKTDSLQYGQILYIFKNPTRVEGPDNPGQFDYQSHLRKKGILHQVFLKENDWMAAGASDPNPVFAFSYRIRDYLLQTLRDNGLDKDEFAVASAILLGYDDKLPQYLRKGYTAAGAMHILCVSGLHVGIVFLIVNFLLGLAGKRRSMVVGRTIILLVSIWIYALITGLSPSVMRATVMLSFVLMGRLISRKGNVINSMSASALILLLIDPMTLYHIGFQLSYLAVLGIVLFHKPIFDLIYVKNKVLRYVWEITVVSIAAQLTTTPLSVYYFDQFPVYFWLSNLFLVPLSFLVIVVGMSVLVLSFIPLISGLVGSLASFLLYLLNYIVITVESLPGSTWQMLHITARETVLMYVILLLMIWLLHFNLRKSLIPMMMCFVVLMISFSARSWNNMQNSKILVYSVGKGTAIGFIHGKQHVLLADSIVLNSEKIIDMNLRGYWTQAGLSGKPELADYDSAFFSNGFFQREHGLIGFQGALFYLWTRDSKIGEHPDGSLIPLRILFVRGNCPEKIDEITKRFDVEMIVLDETVPPWQRKRWAEQSQQVGISLHDVKEQGALLVEL